MQSILFSLRTMGRVYKIHKWKIPWKNDICLRSAQSLQSTCCSGLLIENAHNSTRAKALHPLRPATRALPSYVMSKNATRSGRNTKKNKCRIWGHVVSRGARCGRTKIKRQGSDNFLPHFSARRAGPFLSQLKCENRSY